MQSRYVVRGWRKRFELTTFLFWTGKNLRTTLLTFLFGIEVLGSINITFLPGGHSTNPLWRSILEEHHRYLATTIILLTLIYAASIFCVAFSRTCFRKKNIACRI